MSGLRVAKDVKIIIVREDDTSHPQILTIPEDDWNNGQIVRLRAQTAEEAVKEPGKIATAVKGTSETIATGALATKHAVKGLGRGIKGIFGAAKQGIKDAADRERQENAGKKIEKELEKAAVAEVHNKLDDVLASVPHEEVKATA